MSSLCLDLSIDNAAVMAIQGLIGKVCCRQRVGRGRSLSIGFGEKRFHGKTYLSDDFYGEWEIGTYSASWRVVRDGAILCGSRDIVDSVKELDQCLNSIRFGRILAISVVEKLDIRIDMDDGMRIDFLGTCSEDDEMFHIFGPDDFFMEYSITKAWKVGKSNEPWI